MILTLDRAAATICGGGGVVAAVNPLLMVLPVWCRAALAGGYDLAGLALEVHDTGADDRADGMLCFTHPDAFKVLLPDPKPKRERAAAKAPASLWGDL